MSETNDTSEILVEGEHTTAEIKTTEVDDHCLSQVREIVDHEAFRNPITIMPDAHGGAGAVIGFTMELGDRLCPNTVGVDIGCGMSAFNLGSPAVLEDALDDEERMQHIDDELRQLIPMGRATFGDGSHPPQDYHLVNDFPWDVCEAKLEALNDHWAGTEIESPSYGKEYFLELCERIEYSPKRAIDSIGTLGGGNHFIELSRSEETGDYWAVVHSGSRGIGLTIARYWQQRAHLESDDRADEIRDRLAEFDSQYYTFDLETVSDADLLNWVQGGMGEDWKVMDAVVEDYRESEPKRINATKDELNEIARHASRNADGHDLDYLEGESRHGYVVDMIFAQTYAAESRRQMCETVADCLEADVGEEIVSTHNYIDFEDGTIRKGATRVHDGERAIIPFNMRDGSIIVEGRGNDEWNQSAPHGAGRRGSRTWAFDTFSLEEFTAAMDGIFSTSVTKDTVDESPMAYKDTDVVLERIEETASVEEALIPVMNLKADE